MATNEIRWIPHPKQWQFHKCDAYEVGFGGSKGGGKTESILREATRQIENPRYRAIIFRRTYPRLGEVIDRSHRYYRAMGFTYSGKDIQLGLPCWTTAYGSKISFGHCQNEADKYNYQGKEFQFIAFDQLEEFTETQYLFLIAQNRTSDRTIRCYVRSTMNPGGVGHGWVKKRFIDCLKPGEIKYFKRVNDDDIETTADDGQGISRAFFPASVYDNPSLCENDPDYIRRLEQLPEMDKRALLHGDWEVFAGQFFKEFRKAIHVQEKEINREFFKFLSLDYGYANHSAVYWWQVDRDGGMHAYRELYVSGLEYDALAKEIKRITPEDETMSYCVADPAIWGDKSHHSRELRGESGAETMARIFTGFTQIIKGDNSRVTGWGRMRVLMKPRESARGMAAMMTVSPVCKNWIRTVPTMIHDEVRPEDCDTTGEDHCGDSTRYAVMSRPEPFPIEEKKPEAWTDDWFERQEKRQNEQNYTA